MGGAEGRERDASGGQASYLLWLIHETLIRRSLKLRVNRAWCNSFVFYQRIHKRTEYAKNEEWCPVQIACRYGAPEPCGHAPGV